MKKILYSFFIPVFAVSLATSAPAKTSTVSLFDRLTYVKEWVDLNILSFSKEAKVKALSRYSLEYAKKVETALNNNQTEKTSQLLDHYQTLKNSQNQIIETTNLKDEVLKTAKDGLVQEQKVLSNVRQKADNDETKKEIAGVQQSTTNQIKNVINNTQGSQQAQDLVDQVVSVWRDPGNQVTEEKATRVYAAGTTASGNDGVVIDGGEAMIKEDQNNNVKIVYAPGTGPQSTTGESGQRVWKIQLSDGSVVDSYTSGSSVVIGGTQGVSSNVVVNTINGQETTGQTVIIVNSQNAPAGQTVQTTYQVITGSSSSTVVKTENNQINNSSSNKIVKESTKP